MPDLLDYDRNPIQIGKLYEDKICPVFNDWCFVSHLSTAKGTITFTYDGGYQKQFLLSNAPEFTKHLRLLDDLAQTNFESIVLGLQQAHQRAQEGQLAEKVS